MCRATCTAPAQSAFSLFFSFCVWLSSYSPAAVQCRPIRRWHGCFLLYYYVSDRAEAGTAQRNSMRKGKVIYLKIGTTPTHCFSLPFDVSLIQAIEITYGQNGKVVLQKDERDCTMEGNTVSVELSQLDTFEFKGGENVQIQLRVLDINGAVSASEIMCVSCQKCLSDGVLT